MSRLRWKAGDFYQFEWPLLYRLIQSVATPGIYANAKSHIGVLDSSKHPLYSSPVGITRTGYA